MSASDFETLLRTRGVVPVLTISDEDEGVMLAKALVAGGLDILEVTLRTPAALAAIRAIALKVPSARVGAGTVLTPAHFRDAEAAGASFFVSPGHSEEMCEMASCYNLPWLPGAASVSEVISLRERKIKTVKFFPAEAAGGLAWLKAVAPVLPDVSFCPTGGITALKASDYLKLPNVAAVGGSWLAPEDLIKEKRWEQITQLAREARGLVAQG